MKKRSRKRVLKVIDRLRDFRDTCRPTTLAEVDRDRRSPYALLVSCVISLRTKDAVTAAASGRLLDRAPDPSSLAKLPADTIAELIYPAGFYNTKGTNLRRIAEILEEEHGGRVPGSRDELLELPGVGRKTANLVLGLGFGIPAICVDTHVHRISNRLGWVETKAPDHTEAALEEILPREEWIDINDLLVTFGQNVCHPTSPRCSQCPLKDLCPRIRVTRSR